MDTNSQKTGESFNPRFAAYARANGRSIAEQLAHDAASFPGGKMTGFLIWSGQQIRAAKKSIPQAFAADRLLDHDAYDAWLCARVDAIAKAEGRANG